MPKYADPAVFPVTAPAATDNVMTRTASGADGNFALGNLAGLAPLAVATDQSAYFTGTVWAPYTVTSVGRTLLAATTPPAQRAALGLGTAAVEAVGNSGHVIPFLDQNNQWDGFQSFPGTSYATATLRLTDGTNSLRVFANTGQIFFALSPTVSYRYDGNNITAGSAVTGAVQWPGITPSSFLYPTTTNTVSCGRAGNVWTQVFAQNTTISTSDARLKTDPRQLRDAEFKAASAIARLPAVWRWLSRVHGDENCEPEGKDARKHFGPTVQAAIAVMEANGLDPFAYSFICYDEWEALPEQWHEWEAQEAVLDDDGNEIEPAVEAGRELVQEAREAGDRYSFRKEELLCFIVRALAQEIDGLSDRVAALEAARTP